MDSIKITAADGAGTFDASLPRRRSRPHGVVVLIQEIFGVNDTMKETAPQVAEQGYHVLVARPVLAHPPRREPDRQVGGRVERGVRADERVRPGRRASRT